MRLSRERKRELLIENYIRAITLNPNAVCECEGIQYIYDGKNLIIVDISKEVLDSENLVIDSVYDSLIVSKNFNYIKNLDLNHVKNIEGNFSYGSLESIIGKYIKILPDECFHGCNNLQKVYFPNLEEIGNNVFCGCNSLKYANFPKLSNIGLNSFAYTGLKELVLGDCNFNEYEVHNNAMLRKITLKSTRDMGCESFGPNYVEYLDLGYYYDIANNYCFNPSLTSLVRESISDVDKITSVVHILIKNNLLIGQLPLTISSYITYSNSLYKYFYNFNNLKELHFKLSKPYKDLHLEEYYIKRFEKILYKNNKCSKVILDN